MRPGRLVGTGLAGPAASLGAAPAEVTPVDPDEELLDLLCADATWVDATFDAIVAASWAEPPRRDGGRHAGRPRRHGSRRQRHSRRAVPRGSERSSRPSGRQRSPPRRGR